MPSYGRSLRAPCEPRGRAVGGRLAAGRAPRPAAAPRGDRRNVEDRYRYWSHDAITADLATRRHDFHVAIENWEHDFNIGSVVRTANALGAAAFHVVGKRRWNRRGAMVTDRYQVEHHHPDVASFLAWASTAGEGGTPLPVIGIDNVPGSVPIETHDLPRGCVLVLGQEGPGISRRCSLPATWSWRSASSARRAR